MKTCFISAVVCFATGHWVFGLVFLGSALGVGIVQISK